MPRGVQNATDFIAALRQAQDKAALPVGRRVVVIGGGNTAIDAATQSRLLGAEDVTIVYRRGPAEMSATPKEQEWAQVHGVRIRHFAAPLRLLSEAGAITGVEFARTRLEQGAAHRRTVHAAADMVLTAVGQRLAVNDPSGVPELRDGRIAVNAERQTSIAGVFAGGDCIAGPDLTVQAVQDGKIAAAAIHRRLPGRRGMADLATHFAGIRAPNPFWLASAPPTDKQYNVERAFRAGWGGVVWKTLGEDPPIVNTCSRLRRRSPITASGSQGSAISS